MVHAKALLAQRGLPFKYWQKQTSLYRDVQVAHSALCGHLCFYIFVVVALMVTDIKYKIGKQNDLI